MGKYIFIFVVVMRCCFRLLSVICSATVVFASLSSYAIKDVTVSGVSAGGYMAVQMHVAHSDIISGAAIFAGGPFYCAESTLTYAEKKCMDVSLGPPQVDKLVALTWGDFDLFYIDNPLNMKDDMVYLFSGKADTVVDQTVVKSLQSYYSYFVSPNSIVSDYNVDAEHCFPTVDYGEDCATLAQPFLGNCNFDGAGKALQTLYGNHLVRGVANSSNLMAFSQQPYIAGALNSLSSLGYIYVPTSCAHGAACHLHISFHGCGQSLEDIGNQYAEFAGFNDWAEDNDIIVVYPYVSPSEELPMNPNGCWDWWAYSGVDYGVKTGVQIRFVKSLIDALSGGKLVGSNVESLVPPN